MVGAGVAEDSEYGGATRVGLLGRAGPQGMGGRQVEGEARSRGQEPFPLLDTPVIMPIRARQTKRVSESRLDDCGGALTGTLGQEPR